MTGLPTLFKLIVAQNNKHRVRAAITLLGIAVSVSLVIWNLRGFQLAQIQMAEAAKRQNRFDAVITPKDFRGAQLDSALIEALRQDGKISELDCAVKSRIRLIKPELPAASVPSRGGPFGGTSAIGTGAQAPPLPVREGRWLSSTANEAVISAAFAGRAKLKIGDELVVAGMGQEQALTVVGVLEETGVSAGPGMRSGPPAGEGPTDRQTPPETGLRRSPPGEGDSAGSKSSDNPEPGKRRGPPGDAGAENLGVESGRRSGGAEREGTGAEGQRQNAASPARRFPGALESDLYVSLSTVATINGYSDRPSLLCILLKDPGLAGEFYKNWKDKVAEAKPAGNLRMLKFDANDDPMSGQSAGMQQMLFANATILAFLAAGFIIFVTLSANVRERIRQFAILRAIAMSRRQLVAMIFMEAFLVAALGLGLGLLLIKSFLLVGQNFPNVEFFQSSAFSDRPLGLSIICIAGCCALIGAFAAAVIPAWQASRIKPIDILSNEGQAGRGTFPWPVVVSGLLLIAVNPLIVVLATKYESIRSLLSYFWGWGPRGFGAPVMGSLAMIIGFALITPLTVLVAERLFGPLIARILGLDPRFMRRQLTGNLWRTTGTTIALSVGLALFSTSLVWGYSMLVPFTPTEGLPRMQIAIMPAGIAESDVAKILAVPGVIADECLPLVVEQPKLTEETLNSKPFAHVDEQQRHLLVMGVDPQKAFGGKRPLFDLQFLESDSASAAKKLAEGRYCVVPDHFCTQTGLKVGDSFSVEVPNRPGQKVEYTIAGVAAIPGWNWLTKFSETRRRAVRALALVFVAYDQAKSDYALERVSYFWTNVAKGTTAKDLESRIEPIAKANSGFIMDVPMVGRTAVGSQYVKITDRNDVITMLNRRANDVIWALTWLPLMTLVISSLAVFNAILASVRARFWQIGVLRSVGLTRSQLLRMILAESFMICGAACVLSLVSGIGLAWCGTRLCTLFFFFGGRTPPLVVKWDELGIGFGLAFGMCFLAGIIPAVVAALKEPLQFIQGGRLAAQ